MKKIEVETECGEVSIIYVSQDVAKIIVDGETFYSNEGIEKDDRMVTKGGGELGYFLEQFLQRLKEADREDWLIDYETDLQVLKITWHGTILPRKLFQF